MFGSDAAPRYSMIFFGRTLLGSCLRCTLLALDVPFLSFPFLPLDLASPPLDLPSFTLGRHCLTRDQSVLALDLLFHSPPVYLPCP